MQFTNGARVYSADDHEVGRIERVVMHPHTKQITHVVVRQGLIFTEDKVLPVDLFTETTKDRAVLSKNSEQLENLPKFEETEYVPMENWSQENTDVDNAEPLPSVYWYPSLAVAPYATPGIYGSLPGTYYDDPNYRYVRRTVQNIPEGTVALGEGSRVVSADGEHVGDVERVFSNSATDHATHLLISKGLLFKEHKLIPTFWIKDVAEEEVHLIVNSELLETLPEYEPA